MLVVLYTRSTPYFWLQCRYHFAPSLCHAPSLTGPASFPLWATGGVYLPRCLPSSPVPERVTPRSLTLPYFMAALLLVRLLDDRVTFPDIYV